MSATPSDSTPPDQVPADTTPSGSTQWGSVDSAKYDSKWADLEASGQNAHGEADLVSRFSPASVLDAGCGSGRVAIELARRGCHVVGVDLDEPFINAARAKAPELDFRLDDLATVQLDQSFDVVVMAGNVMIFVAPGTEQAVVSNMAAHLNPGGRLIAGFQLNHNLAIEDYRRAAQVAGLEIEEHWSTWDGDVFAANSDYAVFVHRSPVES